MRCKCCDAILGSHSVVRQITIPHPTDKKKKKIVREDEDMCRKCIIASSPDSFQSSEDQDSPSLYLDNLPIKTIDYYEDIY